ncbi:MAG: thermonuclease family protein [Nitrospirota bacterium]|nr:thermonuclease family protein [Nitrospirota bacterium]
MRTYKLIKEPHTLKKNSTRRPSRIATALFVLLLLPAMAQAAPTSFIAEVVAVLTGDTLKVLKSRQVIVVRLQGIDAPEKTQRYGQQAKDFTESVVFGQKVVINVKGIDRDENIIAEIVLEDGRSLNREIVKAGFAWWHRERSEDLSLWLLEDRARESKLGLWLGEDPVPPWEFRESMRGR